jgi:hypothetical protein
MAALTADFDSYILNQRALTERLVDAGDAIFTGGLLQLDATGTYVEAAASGVTRKIVGQTMKAVASTASADTKVPCREGDIFLNLAEDGADKPVASDIGAVVYAASDNEVTMRTTNNAKVGILIAIENGGAVVRCTQEANL